MKRRRAGVVHTNWGNLMIRWSGWWEVTSDWKSFAKTVEELCKRTLERDEDTKKRGFSLRRKEEQDE